MNILFLAKFYTPFDRGGSEWSTHDLAYLLTKDGHKVTIVTLNYGAKSQEEIDGINIIRIPFPIKLKNSKGSIAPFWTSNIVWFIYTTIFCLYLAIKNHYEIIHVQNNEFLPAGVISAKFSGKKTMATFRDYQTVCSLGFCLWHKNQSCSFEEYLQNDFEFFYDNYVANKNILKYYLLKIAVLRAWVMQKILYFFATHVDYKVAVSQKVKTVFETNGIKNLKVIHNPVIIGNKLSSSYTNKIIYIGKLSKGKGVDIFIEAIPKIASRFHDVSFEIIGSGYLKEKLITFVRLAGLQSKVKFAGHLGHDEALKRVSKSALVVVPSVWPEPLPRSVIETILSGTPVVATNVGGISEIIKNNYYGVLAKPRKNDLEKAIIEGFSKKDGLRKNIQADINKLKNHFSKEVLTSYERLYEEALK
ncbi:MAG: glycosyltransferase family 4 protein [Candidatus Curtissbacteria bacterium]|nr:glycosyltransferase family 4 protein [Candidatus Curtissbacteria bacterium]